MERALPIWLDACRSKAKERLPFLYHSLRQAYSFLPRSLRLPRAYKKNYCFLQESERWDEENIHAWQVAKIRAVVEHAMKYVPYYRQKYSQIGVRPAEIGTLEDIQCLPTVEKADIKAHLQDFVSEAFSKRALVRLHTGGSTGQPMAFYVSREQWEKEASNFHYTWRRLGYAPGDKCVMLKGQKVAQVRKLRFHAYDPIENTLVMDSDYLNRVEYIPYYLKAISSFKADVLFGFPSSIYQLAKTTRAAALPPPQFRLILMAAENTYRDQIEYIRSTFGAEEVSYHYGHSEQVLLAFKDSGSELMRFVPQYGHVEILDGHDRNVLGTEGLSGEIVGTNYSFCMPFIRYRTQDYATSTSERCTDLPAHPAVREIQGRLQEFIVTRDNRLVSICTMGAAHFAEIEHAVETQYYQDRPGEVVFRVVESPARPLTETELKRIAEALEKKLEKKVRVTVAKVDRISRLDSNKKSMIEQELDLTEYLR